MCDLLCTSIMCSYPYAVSRRDLANQAAAAIQLNLVASAQPASGIAQPDDGGYTHFARHDGGVRQQASMLNNDARGDGKEHNPARIGAPCNENFAAVYLRTLWIGDNAHRATHDAWTTARTLTRFGCGVRCIIAAGRSISSCALKGMAMVNDPPGLKAVSGRGCPRQFTQRLETSIFGFTQAD